MTKKVAIILAVFLLVSFSLAFNLEIYNSSVEKEYSLGDFISGYANISLQNISLQSKISSELGEILVRDFLKNTGNQLSCEIYNCGNILKTTDEGTISKSVQLTPQERTFGFFILGNGISVDDFSMGLNSTFSEKNSYPFKIKIGNLFEWQYDTPSSSFSSPREISMGCFNSSAQYSEVNIGSTPYCQEINLSESKSYSLGAQISGSGLSDFVMTLKDAYLGKISECNFTKNTITTYSSDSSCIITFNSKLESGKYYVCINSVLDSTNYKIKRESSGKNCGFYGNPTFELNDYSLFVKTPKYASSSGIINLPEEKKELAVASMNNYIQTIYSSNCSSGCVIPLKITGDNIQATLSNLNIVIESLGGQIISSKFFEVAEEPQKINIFKKLILDDLEWQLSKAGTQKLLIKIIDGNEEKNLINETIFVANSPIILGVYPTNPPAGLPIQYYVNIKNKGNESHYEWNFGDGTQIQLTNKSLATHAYENISTYNITIKFGSGNYIATKSFQIETVSPESYLNTTINDKRQRLELFVEKLESLTEPQKSYIKSIINTNEYIDKINDVETLKTSAQSTEDFLEIAKMLSQIIIPEEMATLSKRTSKLLYDYNTINPSLIAKKTGEEAVNIDAYKSAILEWQIKNVDTQILKEEVVIINEDMSIRNSLVFYSLSIKPKTNENIFFVIQESPERISLRQGETATNIDNIASLIEIKSGTQKEIFFVTNSSIAPTMFISPFLSSLGIEKENPNCNFNNICDSNENYKLCRSDCFPVVPTIIWSIIALIIFLALYTFIQIWYTLNYERKLFGDKEDIYNLVSYINIAKQKNINKKEIEESLSSKGWSQEQITYAMKKSEGKNTGMPEIIPISKIFRKKPTITPSAPLKPMQPNRFRQNNFRRQ